MKDLKICVLSEYAYPFLSGTSEGIGGAELQMSLLANALNEKYDVSFVSFGKGPYISQINELNVYNPFDIENNGFNYMNPKNLYILFNTLRKINADIYIQRGVSPLTGLVSIFCKIYDKKFVYSAASDAAVSKFLNFSSISDTKNLLYKLGVSLSSSIVSQSKVQKDLLENRGLKSVLIRNAYFPSPLKDRSSNLNSIWVGRISKEKRPDLYLEIAKSIPEHKFIMIGAPSNDFEYYRNIEKDAHEIQNLKFLGFIPHEKINKYYSCASLLINTSEYEGFPNTFLEAWGNSIPVITFVDPDNVISSNHLGIRSNNFEEMVEKTRKLLENQDMRKEMGINAQKYVLKEHNFNNVVESYEKLFRDLLKPNSL